MTVKEIEESYFDYSIKKRPSCQDQHFYGNGKLLMTGEYFVLDGADAIGLPTRPGQSLSVRYGDSYSPKLFWKSFDRSGTQWFDASFEFWNFEYLGDESPTKEIRFIQRLLRQMRKQNKHFLRDEVDVFVETRLGFPLTWGLGSSSSLIYNLAQWAYVSPFELLFNSVTGSGYDVACAQATGPILYNKGVSGPIWSPVKFDPDFKEDLYLLYLGNKQNTEEGIKYYQKNVVATKDIVAEISQLAQEILVCQNLSNFNKLIKKHELLVSGALKMPRVKDKYFSDFYGEVKSLGAWGGDFVLVTSDRGHKETEQYFIDKGYDHLIPYSEIILEHENNRSLTGEFPVQ